MPEILWISVVPSPYQRDFFRAWMARAECGGRVLYQQGAADDSPWAAPELEPWEEILPGWGLGSGRVRFQCNRLTVDPGQFDGVVVNGSLTSPFVQWLMRWKLSGVPWWFWGERIRRDASVWKNRIRGWWAAPLARAAGVAAVGRLAADDYAERFPGLPVANIPYHCRLDAFYRPARISGRSEVVILFCGQIIARKGVDVLLEAFSRLCAERMPVRLRLVGRKGEWERLRADLPEHVAERVEWRGFVQPEGLPGEFADVDLFVLPSRHDGWGVVVNQALGAGLPLVVSDGAGAAWDLVDEGQNGFRVPADRADVLADRLAELCRDEGLRARMGAVSRSKAEAWGPEQAVDKWLAAFRQGGIA
jgi:glycosyltransferase involved in cell wall biosynthesis